MNPRRLCVRILPIVTYTLNKNKQIIKHLVAAPHTPLLKQMKGRTTMNRMASHTTGGAQEWVKHDE